MDDGSLNTSLNVSSPSYSSSASDDTGTGTEVLRDGMVSWVRGTAV